MEIIALLLVHLEYFLEIAIEQDSLVSDDCLHATTPIELVNDTPDEYQSTENNKDILALEVEQSSLPTHDKTVLIDIVGESRAEFPSHP